MHTYSVNSFSLTGRLLPVSSCLAQAEGHPHPVPGSLDPQVLLDPHQVNQDGRL